MSFIIGSAVAAVTGPEALKAAVTLALWLLGI